MMSKVTLTTTSGRVALAVLLIGATIVAQKPSELGDNQLWFNSPSCPLKIERTPNGRFVTLNNYSSARIERYRLGCAKEVNGKSRIFYRFSSQQFILEPREENTVSSTLLDLKDHDLQKCLERKAKIAVVTVLFSDGASWTVN